MTLEQYKEQEALYTAYTYRDEPAQRGDDAQNGFENGFESAMGLDLPAKFLTWCADNGWYRNGRQGLWYQIPNQNENNKTPEELYQHWIKNIYKIS